MTSSPAPTQTRTAGRKTPPSRQTFRMVIAGMSGTGKTTLGRKIIRAMKGRYSKLVVVNRKNDLSGFCAARYAIQGHEDPGPALARHDRVFFRVDGMDPRPFMDRLGHELLKYRDVLIVVDEAWEFFPRGRSPRGFFMVLTRGRSLGHNVIMITQQLQSTGAGIDLIVLDQATHVVLFKLGHNDIDRASYLYPELGPRCLRFGHPMDGGAPEFCVLNKISMQGGAALRDPRNPKRTRWHSLAPGETLAA